MRKKELRLVVTFHTTTEAMAMEEACRAADAPGRVIPVPGEISAGCGLAWCVDPDGWDAVDAVMKARNLKSEGVFTCMG